MEYVLFSLIDFIKKHPSYLTVVVQEHTRRGKNFYEGFSESFATESRLHENIQLQDCKFQSFRRRRRLGMISCPSQARFRGLPSVELPLKPLKR